jgi:hypothetical protein
VVYLGLLVRRRKAIAAENLFLRRQLALYQERKVLKPSASFPFAQFEGRTVSLTCLGLILFDSTNLSVFDISNAMNQAYKSWYFAFGSSSIFIFTVCSHCVQPAVAAAQSARAIAESANEGVHAGLASPTPVSTRELAGDLVDLAGLPNPR